MPLPGSEPRGRHESAANHEMLTVLRESRGLTQAQLSRQTGILQSEISRYEASVLPVPPHAAQAFADALGVTLEMLQWTDGVKSCGNSCVYNRRKASISMLELKKAAAQINLFRMRVTRLVRSVENFPEVRFFSVEPGDMSNEIPRIARLVRQTWQLPPGPIINLTTTIESCGAVILRYDFGHRGIDALSQWVGTPPVMFVNHEAPADRLRRSLAHEVGHLVLHRLPTAEMEEEAEAFASEFLMPADEIAPHLRPLTLDKLANLKLVWRVSMQSIVMRAFHLGKISKFQQQRLFMEFSKRGWRMHEPVELPQEKPTLFAQLLGIHSTHLGYSESDLATLFGLRSAFDLRSQYSSVSFAS